MKTKALAILVAGLFVFGTGETVWAVMVSPQNVIYNSMGYYNYYYAPQKMIDHSGLLTDFISGNTELSTYLEAGAPGHSAGAHTGFASNFTTSGIIDFDLGDTYELSTLLLWTDIDYQGINNFQLFIDDDSSFSNATWLGSFSASYGAIDGVIPMQQFTLNEAKGRFVRLQVFDIHPGGTPLAQIAEMAFDAVTPDSDGDGVANDIDNCPDVFNPDQANFDDDVDGNVCDSDDDNDGVIDELDNCQYDFNQDQYDLDGDGVGDVCDADVDGDFVMDADDECLETVFGMPVNEKGCSVDQICPCDNGWTNHGGYVSCVDLVLNNFVADGLMSDEDKDYYVSEAATSSCGQKDQMVEMNQKVKKNKKNK